MIRKVTLAALGFLLAGCGGEVETPAPPSPVMPGDAAAPLAPEGKPMPDLALWGTYSGTDVAYMTVGWQENELHGRGRVPWKEESYRLHLRSDGTYTLTMSKHTVLRIDASTPAGSRASSAEPAIRTREGAWKPMNGDVVLQESPAAAQEVWRVDRQEGQFRLERDGITLKRER